MSHRGTIRRQLATLLFVVVFPLLVLFLAFLLFAWKNATEHASQSTLALARLEAREITELIEDVQHLADRLAERPIVRQARAGHCDPMMDEALKLQRHVEFIAVADTRGQIVCTTHPPVDGRMPNVAGNPFFARMLGDSAPPPSQPFRSQITGHWVSLISRRLTWDGRVSGALGIALDLVSMQDMFANNALPNGGTVTVVDSGGTVVARVPETAAWVGKSMRGVEVVSTVLEDGEGVVEADGLDGVRRIYAFTTVQGTKWRVYAGVPVGVAFSSVRNLTRIGIATIAIALAVALFFAALVVRGLVLPIRRLEQEIETLPGGDDRIDLPEDSPAEMVRVVEAMNELLARRAEAERAVAEHGQLLEGILDGASDLISVRDLEGRIVHVNQATLDWLGMKREDVIGRLASELSDDPGAQRIDEEARRVARTGESTVSEDPIFDSRKDEVFVTTRTPLRDETGRITGVVIASKDVSELRMGERERTRLAGEVRRREAVSALGALVGSVAHEVRNPLFAISSTLDAVIARFRTQPELGPFLEVLKRETVRLNKIMNELLEYGRARAEELRPDRVEPAVETAVELCRPQAAARRVRLDLRITSGLPTVSMDRDRLVMAMRNVVDNAIRHAPAGTTVAVRVGLQPENGGGVEFQVRDRGPGFSPEVLQRLFEPFITQRPGGIGLGLYLVKRIVEDHGGRVFVENAFDGGGLVRLWIPHDGAQAGGPRDAVA